MSFDDRTTRQRRTGVGGTGLAIAAVAWLMLLAALTATAQTRTADCAGLRARIDALDVSNAAGTVAAALRRQRDDIARLRAYADDSGCGSDALYDESDSAQCRMLTRRIERIEADMQHVRDQAAQDASASEDRRRALGEQFDADCAAGIASAAPPAEAPPTTMPVDPDAPAPDAAPAPRAVVAQVFCVRHCDGAYYPLATGVPADGMGDMDRLCQAQCPAAESSAYAGHEGEDVSLAQTPDGTAYTALPSAFKFQTGTTPQCACRAPHQSWAAALAGAEALIEPHRGDITVTPALAAAMARPVVPPPPSPARPAPAASAATPAPKTARPASAARAAKRRTDPEPSIPPPADPAQDVMRAFRRSDPTL